MNTPSHAALERNVRLYQWYAALFHAYFWLPIFFLYFAQHVTLAQVLQLEAIYYAAVVILEVPSGYFSDTIGRRKTLLVSSAALVGAYSLFFLSETFVMLAAAQICLAVGIAFNSGTDTSFHYDSLAALGRSDEFARREAIVSRNTFGAGAIAAVLGGLIAAIELRFAYGLSFIAAILTFGLVLRFAEPITHQSRSESSTGFIQQLIECFGYLRNGSLRWLMGFAVLMIVLNHVPYEFYQPYIDILVQQLRLPDRDTPISLGLHAGLTMIAGSWFAARSIRLRDRIGLGPALLTACALQVVIIAVMGIFLHPLIVVLILLRSVPRALMTAPMNAAIAPQIHMQHRATYLSIQSLVGRLSFSGVLFSLSLLASTTEIATWDRISFMLQAAGMLGIAGLLALLVTIRSAKGKA